MNFQNLLSSLTITFLSFLSLKNLSPVNFIFLIKAFSPVSILYIRFNVSLLFSFTVTSTFAK